jgi:delta-aminolevulinic acid dehydratase/porphobilinogen synthase
MENQNEKQDKKQYSAPPTQTEKEKEKKEAQIKEITDLLMIKTGSSKLTLTFLKPATAT